MGLCLIGSCRRLWGERTGGHVRMMLRRGVGDGNLADLPGYQSL